MIDTTRRIAMALVQMPGDDMTLRQLAVFLIVYGTVERVTYADLHRVTRIHKAALTRALDALQRRGLIRRSTCEDDRRQVIVRRTWEGENYLNAMADALDQLPA